MKEHRKDYKRIHEACNSEKDMLYIRHQMILGRLPMDDAFFGIVSKDLKLGSDEMKSEMLDLIKEMSQGVSLKTEESQANKCTGRTTLWR